MVVLRGHLQADEELFELDEGDALVFQSRRPHRGLEPRRRGRRGPVDPDPAVVLTAVERPLDAGPVGDPSHFTAAYGRIVRRLIATIGAVALLGFAACDRAATRATASPSVGRPGHVVVDTDMSTDDILALLYLLRRPDVTVDAITVAGDGVAHCTAGVENARSVLALAGKPDVPVACGRETPLQGTNAFPEEWRDAAGDLRRLDLPAPAGDRSTGSALDLLRTAMGAGDAVLTLGPYTNVAEALRADPSLAGHVGPVVSMAGAIDVPGNAPGGVAEFNVWIDPTAAKEVLAAIPVTLVPLDATNQVPTTTFFLDALARHRTTPEARAAYALLEDNPQIPVGQYFFWDPLAATLLTQPELASFEDTTVLVTVSADAGNGWISRWDRGVAVRIASAVPDPLAFERAFLSTLAGEVVTDVRPAPDATIAFDGTTCTFRTHGPLASGSRTFIFRNATDRTAVAAVAGFGGGMTYGDLLAVLGPPASSIREAPPGVTVLASTQAESGATSYLAVDATTPSVAAVCGYQHGRSFQIWPGGAATVRR